MLEQAGVGLGFRSQDRPDACVVEGGRNRAAIREGCIDPEFRRIGHGLQPAQRHAVRLAPLDGIDIRYVEGPEIMEATQSVRDGDDIRALAERRDDRLVEVAPASVGPHHLAAFQVENRDDTQRTFPLVYPMMKA